MLTLFDAHNHIQDEKLYSRLPDVMERAETAGVERMAVKGCCEEDWPKIIDIVNRYPHIHFSFGVHPWLIAGRSERWQEILVNLLTTYSQAAVGEIGIDHAVDPRDEEDQERVFLAQLKIAADFSRPATIHCRKAWGRLLDLLDACSDLPSRLLIHCFGGSAAIASELVKRGSYISFSGSITRPGNHMAEAAIRAVPDDRILIETDAPSILPSTAQGDFNEPANLRLVLAKAAELRGVSEEELSKLTYENAERFFNF